MKISIVIPYFDAEEYLPRCLESIKAYTYYHDYEIILVDDGSKQPVSAEIKKKFSRVRFYRNRKNLGFVRTVNRGAALARGGLLVFLNVDTEIVSPGWLYTVLKTFALDKSIAVVGGKLIYPDTHLIQFAGGAINPETNGSEHIYKFAPAFIPQVNKMREVEVVTGAFLAIKKDLFNELGAFSLDFHSTYEDTDLCLRIRERGLKVIYQPEVVIYHYETVSGITDANYFKSKLILNRKWSRHFRRWQRSYYREDGFSETFVRTMLKLFQNDFFNLFVIVEEMGLSSADRQEKFIKSYGGRDLLEFLISRFKGRDSGIKYDLHYYLFINQLEQEQKFCPEYAEYFMQSGENSLKKDLLRIFLCLLDGRDWKLSEFYQPKYRDIYLILRAMAQAEFKPDPCRAVYQQALLHKILKMLRQSLGPGIRRADWPFLAYFLENNFLFKENEDLISILFSLAYADFRGRAERYLELAGSLIGQTAWPPSKMAKFRINQAVFWERRGVYEKALDVYQALLAGREDLNQKEMASLFYHLGFCNNAQGRYGPAREYFRLCLESAPDHQQARSLLAGIKKTC